MDPVVVTPMQTIINTIGDIITAAVDWVGTTIDVFTNEGNELLLFSVLIGFVGVGIGLLRRLFKLHA